MIGNGKIKLSIVIPYYKTYELTEKLLKNISTQTTRETEVILIDDGCNEKRLDIYNGYCNIIIKHKYNGGVSSARNMGIELATGQYIAFIDSDDMVMPNYVDTLLELIETRNEDIILFNWLDINTNDVVRHPSNPAVWKAIYKKEILPRFDENLKVKEDYYFNEELDKENHTKYYYDKVLYIYNSDRENSLTWLNSKGEI